jgi:hypothetical protein
MMMTYLKRFSAVTFVSAAVLFGGIYQAQAADLTSRLDDVNTTATFQDEPLENTIGSLINVFLGILGIIFLLLVIYAGFLWMTAGGEEDQVSEAKKLMINGVVGLILILTAYAITGFVVGALTEDVGL